MLTIKSVSKLIIICEKFQGIQCKYNSDHQNGSTWVIMKLWICTEVATSHVFMYPWLENA